MFLGSFKWAPECLSCVKSNILWCVWDTILSISFTTVITCCLITNVSAAAISFSSFFAHYAVLAATEHVSKWIFYTKDPSKLQSISFFDSDSVPCDGSQLLLFSPQHFAKFGWIGSREKFAVCFCPPLLLNHDVFSKFFFLILSFKEDFADLCSFVPDSIACVTFLLKLLIPETIMNLTWLRL